MTMSSATASALRAELQTAIAAVAAKYNMELASNVDFRRGRGSTPEGAESWGRLMKLDLVSKSTRSNLSGVNIAALADVELERHMKAYGITQKIGRKGERLTGYNARRPKYPFSYETARGARYKCTVSQAKALFG